MFAMGYSMAISFNLVRQCFKSTLFCVEFIFITVGRLPCLANRNDSVFVFIGIRAAVLGLSSAFVVGAYLLHDSRFLKHAHAAQRQVVDLQEHRI